jgi:hypothetical protein
MVDQGMLAKQREKLAKFAFVVAVWGCYADREHHYVHAKESPYQRMRLMKPPAVFLSLSLGLFATAAWAALKPGDAAPDFTLEAALGGKEFKFSLAEALKKGPVVLYFRDYRCPGRH